MAHRTLKPGQTVPYYGIFCMFTAMFLFSVSQTGAKFLMVNGISPFVISWGSLLVHGVLTWAVFAIFRKPWRAGISKLWLQILRGICLFGASFCGYSALLKLQLAELVSIAFLAPFVVAILARIVLGEHISSRRWMVIAIGFCGVLVITRPGFGVINSGHLVGMVSVLFYSVYVILTRFLSGTESVESMILVPAITGVLFLTPALGFGPVWPDSSFGFGLIGLVGLCSALGHWMFVEAYGSGPASVLAPYGYIQMLWSVLLGYLVFSQLPDAWTLAGAAIISVSGLYMVYLDQNGQQRQ